MLTSLFDFHLPEQLIAQEPLPDRDASRLLLLNRREKNWSESYTRELASHLIPGDLLILNNTRVIPARLRAIRDSSGGKVEFLLLPPDMNEATPSDAATTPRRVLTKAGGKLLVGESFTLLDGTRTILRERHGEAGDLVEFQCSPAMFETMMLAHGEVPLPPYVRRGPGPSTNADRERYQTVFAQKPGAVAAPTAGLHFTESQFHNFTQRGIGWKHLTLHVGPGTFRPVKADVVTDHFVDPEPFHIPAETVNAIRQAKAERRRVIAVGTTSLRTLEGATGVLEGDVESSGLIGKTGLFVHPPYNFKVADGLITNFHIPKSSLLMLVCAFASPGNTDGIDYIKGAYEYAVREQYRFYSYGDACLLL